MMEPNPELPPWLEATTDHPLVGKAFRVRASLRPTFTSHQRGTVGFYRCEIQALGSSLFWIRRYVTPNISSWNPIGRTETVYLTSGIVLAVCQHNPGRYHQVVMLSDTQEYIMCTKLELEQLLETVEEEGIVEEEPAVSPANP